MFISRLLLDNRYYGVWRSKEKFTNHRLKVISIRYKIMQQKITTMCDCFDGYWRHFNKSSINMLSFICVAWNGLIASPGFAFDVILLWEIRFLKTNDIEWCPKSKIQNGWAVDAFKQFLCRFPFSILCLIFNICAADKDLLSKHMCAQKKPKTLNNRLKNMQNKTVITIIS
jgi:hypothetical protein